MNKYVHIHTSTFKNKRITKILFSNPVVSLMNLTKQELLMV